MSTVIRPKISEKNKYWIEKHRYYELKHFCLQYPLWKKELAAISFIAGSNHQKTSDKHRHDVDPVSEIASKREVLIRKVSIVDEAMNEADAKLGTYILFGILNGVSYDVIRAKFDIPCGKEKYYDLYRRFFWILDKLRK